MTKEKNESENVEMMLRRAAKKPLSPEEIKEQRVSFAIGTMGSKSKITKKEVKELVEKQYGH